MNDTAQLKRVRLLSPGTKLDAYGRTFEITPEMLEEIAESFSEHRSRFLPPLVPTHLGGDDRNRTIGQDAEGLIDEVEWDGQYLSGIPVKVQPSFSAAIAGTSQDGSFTPYLSPRLTPPDFPYNPNPGKWSLGHVARVALPADPTLGIPDFSQHPKGAIDALDLSQLITEDPTPLWLGVYLREEEARNLGIEGEGKLTLASNPKYRGEDLEAFLIHARRAVEDAAPFDLTVTGWGFRDAGNLVYATVDRPEAMSRILSMLAMFDSLDRLLESPHIPIRRSGKIPDGFRPKGAIRVDRLSLTVGDLRIDFPLEGQQPLYFSQMPPELEEKDKTQTPHESETVEDSQDQKETVDEPKPREFQKSSSGDAGAIAKLQQEIDLLKAMLSSREPAPEFAQTQAELDDLVRQNFSDRLQSLVDAGNIPAGEAPEHLQHLIELHRSKRVSGVDFSQDPTDFYFSQLAAQNRGTATGSPDTSDAVGTQPTPDARERARQRYESAWQGGH
ncbi:MAG: hypothetical protein J7642_21290 [Cyanobacteria bacterium SBC]|nr:hypothetical protein [Cyanobacteria bacterium SBC]